MQVFAFDPVKRELLLCELGIAADGQLQWGDKEEDVVNEGDGGGHGFGVILGEADGNRVWKGAFRRSCRCT